MAHLHKFTVQLLVTFVRFIITDDLTTPFIAPKKKKLTDVSNGVRDKRTGGPLLIELAYLKRAIPLISSISEMVIPETSRIFITPPTNIPIRNENMNINLENISPPWVFQSSSLFVTDCDVSHPLDSRKINNHADLLEKIFLARLPQFLSMRIPHDKPSLMPGYHWVWLSLRYNIKN